MRFKVSWFIYGSHRVRCRISDAMGQTYGRSNGENGRCLPAKLKILSVTPDVMILATHFRQP